MRSALVTFALCAVGITLALPSAADQLMVNGKARTYTIAQPATAKGPKPAIIVLRDAKDSGAAITQSTKLDTLAPQQGFVAVFPDGQNQQWNFFLPGKELDFYVKAMKASGGVADDGAFLKALIADLVQRGIADPRRIYIAGESNGSLLALRMICTDANLFAGAALLATGMPETLGADCHPPRPIPVLMIKGTKDEMMPYAGGLVEPSETIRVWSADKLVGFFQQLDSDTGPPQSSVLPRKVPNFVEIDRWASCLGIPLSVYRVIDGPHIAPADLNEGQVVLDFFASPVLKSQCVASLQNPASAAGTPANPGGGPNNNPGANNPDANNNPGANNPGANNPGANNPGANNPGANNPGANNPGANNPGANNADANNPGANNPGANNPGANNPGANNPNGQGTGPNGQGSSPNSGSANANSDPNASGNGPANGTGPTASGPNAPSGPDGASSGSPTGGNTAGLGPPSDGSNAGTNTAGLGPPPDSSNAGTNTAGLGPPPDSSNAGTNTAGLGPPPDSSNAGTNTAGLGPPPDTGNNGNPTSGLAPTPSGSASTASGSMTYPGAPMIPPIAMPPQYPAAPGTAATNGGSCITMGGVPTCAPALGPPRGSPTPPPTTTAMATPPSPTLPPVKPPTATTMATPPSPPLPPANPPPVADPFPTGGLNCGFTASDGKSYTGICGCQKGSNGMNTCWNNAGTSCTTSQAVCSPPGTPPQPDTSPLVLHTADPSPPQLLPPMLTSATASTGTCNPNMCSCPTKPSSTNSATPDPDADAKKKAEQEKERQKEAQQEAVRRQSINDANNAANAANAAAAAMAVMSIVGAFGHHGGGGGGGGGGHPCH